MFGKLISCFTDPVGKEVRHENYGFSLGMWGIMTGQTTSTGSSSVLNTLFISFSMLWEREMISPPFYRKTET